MTASKFRELAISLPGAVEAEHMNHPDFRVDGKVFASLGYPSEGWGMVRLSPEQQEAFVKGNPGMFRPCNGAWGRQGATSVYLESVTVATLRTALRSAWKNVYEKRKKARA